MPHTLYKTQGTCSQFIDVTVDVWQVFFMGGCDGNRHGICTIIIRHNRSTSPKNNHQ